MDLDHPSIREALKQEEQGPSVSTFILFREKIWLILDHANSDAKNSVIDETEADLERHYELEHLTLHEKLSLKRLLEDGRTRPPR